VDHRLRRSRLIERLPDSGVDALLVTSPPNVRYLTGFTGSNGQALIGADGGTFLTDGRYAEQSRREVPELELVTYFGGLAGPVREACAAAGIERLGFESAHVTYAAWRSLVDACPGVELVPVEPEVERLRWAKDPEEMDAIDRAQDAADRAFDSVLDLLVVGMTERQVALALEDGMRHAGADGLSFESIVAFGENAAEPHHEPNHRALEEGDVVKLDFGALWSGYHSDMTRTISFGSPPAELRKIHDVVREAQQTGIDAVRAGAVAGDVDRAARTVIEDAGYGENFGHGLGHGVGLEIHEGPRFHPGSEHVLPMGAVVTIEPGIYVPGVGGVRIEDMVEVTDDGCRVIPTSTRELIEL
jgi:Xaa-Pro aminopeptidase